MTLILGAFTIFLAFVTLLPLSKIPHGFVRGPAFARFQWFCIALAVLLVVAVILDGASRTLLSLALIGVASINAVYIAKFTALWPKQSRSPNAALTHDTARHLRIISSNVKMSNRDYDRLLALVSKENPDILVAIETDAAWLSSLTKLHSAYPFRIEVPRDTGYGMAVFSRLPILEHDVQDRITKGVPSIRLVAKLNSGDPVAIYVAHPEPPIATHDTLGRDSEIVAIGIAARDDPLPAIVTGDLNDVAWSTTTRRFQRISGLLDPRVGRGFFNTFHAHYPMFRWPLDHLFHDANFRLVDMERLPDIGSDHFPISFTLALADTKDGDAPRSDALEESKAQHMIRKETARDRIPIGTDWER